MRTFVIIILLIVVFGLYFYTDLTKDVIMATGEFLVEKAKGIVN